MERYHLTLLLILISSCYGTSPLFRIDDFRNTLHEAFQEATSKIVSLHNEFTQDVTTSLPIEFWNETNFLQRTKRNVVTPTIPPIPSYIPSVPEIGVSEKDFFHGFVDQTGAWNREEIRVTKVAEHPIQVGMPSPPFGWKYARYNSSDFFASLHQNAVFVWRFGFPFVTLPRPTFDTRQALCFIDLRNEGLVISSELTTKIIHHSMVLRLSVILTTPHNGFLLKTFDVKDFGCSPATFVALAGPPRKISFISSHYDSAEVILTEGPSPQPEISIKQNAGLYRIIEISVQQARDLDTFTYAGHVYLIVAHDRGIQIGRFNEILQHYMPYEFLPIGGTTDVAVFQMGFSYFLVVSTIWPTHYIYEFKRESFHLRQRLDVHHVTAIHPIVVPTCRDDVLLVVLRRDRRHPILLFSWNGLRREFVPAVENMRRFIPFDYDLIPNSMISYSFNGTGFVLAVDTKFTHRLLSFQTILIDVPDPVYQHTLQTTEVMKNLRDRLTAQEQYTQIISRWLETAVRPSSSHTFHHPHVFRNLIVHKPSITSKIRELKEFNLQGSTLTLQDLKIKTGHLKDLGNSLIQEFKKIDGIFKNVAFTSQPTIMTGRDIIMSADVISINATAVRVDKIVDTNVNELLDKIWSWKRPVPILGRKVMNELNVGGELKGLVNGIDLRRVVTTFGPNVITGPLAFNRIEVRDNLVIRDVNGIDLVRDVINLDGGVYRVSSTVFFSVPPTIFALTSDAVNGVDIRSLTHGVLFTSGNQIIKSSLVLSGKIMFKKSANVGYLNGDDIKLFANDIVRLDVPFVIVSPKVFFTAQLVIRQSLTVNGTINGVRIPHDLMLRKLPQMVTAPKKLVGRHEFRVFIAEKTVDKIRIPQDVFSISKPEMFPPLTFMNGIDVFKDILEVRFVDGVELNKLQLYGIRPGDKGGRLFNPVFSGPVIVRGTMEVIGNVNGLKLRQISNDFVRFHDPPTQITGIKTFLKGVTVPQGLRVLKINGHNLNNLVSTKGFDVVNCRLILSRSTFRNITIKDSLINNVKLLSFLSNRISLRNPGLISGHKKFVDEFRAASISIDGTIQGLIPLRDLTRKSAHNQLVLAEKRFKHLEIRGLLRVNRHISARIVDGVNLTRLAYQRVTLDTPQVMKMSAVVMQSRAESLFAPIVNGVDFGRFFSNILMKSGMNQIITGNKVFLSPIHVRGDIETTRGVNGIRLQELQNRAINRRGVNVISANLTFVAPVTTGRVISRLINGIDLNVFTKEVLFKKSTNNIVLSGNQFFANGFAVTGNIDTPRVNNMHLPSSILLRVGNQTIHSNVIFKRPFVVKRDILTNYVNDLRLSKFDQEVWKTNVPSTVNADLTFFNSIHARTRIKVGGRVSGIKLSHLHRNTLYKIYDQYIPSEKTFVAPVRMESDVNVVMVNNESFGDTLKDIVFVVGPPDAGRVWRHKKFAQVCIVHGNFMSMSKETISRGFVNGINLMNLLSNSIRGNQLTEVTGTFTFVDTVSIPQGLLVRGRVNRINVMNDVVYLYHPNKLVQYIFGNRTIHKITALRPLYVTGRVNGYNLTALVIDTLMSTGNQIIHGRKTFVQPLSVVNTTVHQLNNLHNFIYGLVRLQGPQNILGRLNFVRPIQILGDTRVVGRVNHRLNLTELFTYSLTRNTRQVISGPMTFDSVVFVGDVVTAGPVSGVYLNRFAQDVFDFKQQVQLKERSIDQTTLNQLKRNNYVFDLLYDSLFVVDSFQRRQELRNVYGDSIKYLNNGIVTISEVTNYGFNNTVHQLQFRPDANLFDITRVSSKIPVIQRISFQLSRGVDFSIIRFSVPDKVITEIRMRGKNIATLDPYIDEVAVLIQKSNSAIIATLIGVKGHIKIHMLRFVDNRVNLRPIAILNVGPSATKMSLFPINHKIFLAVARSFRGQCTVSDFGSLIFEMIDQTTFKLVQRLPVSDSNHIVFYEFNGQHYLAFSDNSEAPSLESKSSGIEIFQRNKGHSGCQFSLFQSLKFDNIRDLQVVSFGPYQSPQLLLMAISGTKLTVWSQSGSSSFVNSWKMKVNGGQTIQPIWIPNRGFFIIVGQDRHCRGSLIIEARTKGSTLQPIRFVNNWNVIT